MKPWWAIALALLPLPAGAITPEEFDRLTLGKTVRYERHGQPYGTEQYLRDGRVIWAFEGDECLMGRWTGRDGLICFTYDPEDGESCWEFEPDGASFRARVAGDDPIDDLIAVEITDAPITCPLPGLGA